MKIIFYSVYLFILRAIRALFLLFVLYPLFLLVLISLKLLFFFFSGPDSLFLKNNLNLKSSFFGDNFLKEWSLPSFKSNLFFRTFKIFRPLQDFYLLRERQQLFYHLFFNEHYNIVFRSLNSFFYSFSSNYNFHFNSLFFFFLFDSSLFRLVFFFPLFVLIRRFFIYYFYFFFSFLHLAFFYTVFVFVAFFFFLIRIIKFFCYLFDFFYFFKIYFNQIIVLNFFLYIIRFIFSLVFFPFLFFYFIFVFIKLFFFLINLTFFYNPQNLTQSLFQYKELRYFLDLFHFSNRRSFFKQIISLKRYFLEDSSFVLLTRFDFFLLFAKYLFKGFFYKFFVLFFKFSFVSNNLFKFFTFSLFIFFFVYFFVFYFFVFKISILFFSILFFLILIFNFRLFSVQILRNIYMYVVFFWRLRRRKGSLKKKNTMIEIWDDFLKKKFYNKFFGTSIHTVYDRKYILFLEAEKKFNEYMSIINKKNAQDPNRKIPEDEARETMRRLREFMKIEKTARISKSSKMPNLDFLYSFVFFEKGLNLDLLKELDSHKLNYSAFVFELEINYFVDKVFFVFFKNYFFGRYLDLFKVFFNRFFFSSYSVYYYYYYCIYYTSYYLNILYKFFFKIFFFIYLFYLKLKGFFYNFLFLLFESSFKGNFKFFSNFLVIFFLRYNFFFSVRLYFFNFIFNYFLFFIFYFARYLQIYIYYFLLKTDFFLRLSFKIFFLKLPLIFYILIFLPCIFILPFIFFFCYFFFFFFSFFSDVSFSYFGLKRKKGFLNILGIIFSNFFSKKFPLISYNSIYNFFLSSRKHLVNTISSRFKDLKSIVSAVVYENQFSNFYFVEFFLNRFLNRRKLLTSKGIFDKNLTSWAENYKLNLNLFFQRKKFYEEGCIFFRRTTFIPESNKFRFFLELLSVRSFLIFQLNIFIFLYFIIIIIILIFFFDKYFSYLFVFFVVFFFPFVIKMSLYYLQKRLKMFTLGFSLLFFRPMKLTLRFDFFSYQAKKELFLKIALTRFVLFSTILSSTVFFFHLFFFLFLFQIFIFYFIFSFFVDFYFYLDFFLKDYFFDKFYFFNDISFDFFFLFFGFNFDIILSFFSLILVIVFFYFFKIFFYDPLVIFCLRYRNYLIFRLLLFLLVPSSVIIFLWVFFNKFLSKKYLFVHDEKLLKLPFYIKININTLKHELTNIYVFYSIENKLIKNFFFKKNRD